MLFLCGAQLVLGSSVLNLRWMPRSSMLRSLGQCYLGKVDRETGRHATKVHARGFASSIIFGIITDKPSMSDFSVSSFL